MDPPQERMQHQSNAASGIGPGCLFAATSTVVTCMLLFINGSMVTAIYSAVAETGPAVMHDPRLIQFVLFVGPVLLVVAQWVMIDYVLSRLRRSP